MLFISRLNLDPALNLSCEEYLLHHFDEEVFMLWRNEASVIIGKHQNALAEINVPFTLKHNIPVHRRLSGGGTVFHDLGNVNFTFIRNIEDRDKMINFRKYAKPILDALLALGVNASFSERNDIFIEGLKVSGNAEHLYQKKKRVLHHGTLLFNSQLDQLNEAIRTNPDRYIDKAVNSVRSKVANISNYLMVPMSVEAFMEHIFEFVRTSDSEAENYELTHEDLDQIELLAASKYKTWAWNFGYSPGYQVERIIQTASLNASVGLSVEKGLITAIQSDDARFEQLYGLPHQPQAIQEKLAVFFEESELFELTLQLF